MMGQLMGQASFVTLACRERKNNGLSLGESDALDRKEDDWLC